MEISERKIKEGTKYRHFKGNVYTVLLIGYDSETGGKVVIYKNSHEDVYVRDYEMFASLVDREKYPLVEQKYRFEEILESVDKE